MDTRHASALSDPVPLSVGIGRPGQPKATGRWSKEEHEEFLRCLQIYGREWKKVSERIRTRTAAQIRCLAASHVDAEDARD